MSETKFKSPRSLQEIQGEYQSMCARAGYLQYQIYINQKDLDLVNETLRDLNAEALASNQAAAEAKAKADAEAKAKEGQQTAEQPQPEGVVNNG